MVNTRSYTNLTLDDLRGLFQGHERENRMWRLMPERWKSCLPLDTKFNSMTLTSKKIDLAP